jgi:hypothetical protein
MLCVGCNGTDFEFAEYEAIADRLTIATAKRIEQEKNLIFFGIGGSMMGDIKEMMIAFQYRQEVDFDTGRRLLVYAAEEYLKAINSSEEVRPYLHEYPFSNVEVEIYFVKPNGSYVSPSFLRMITLYEGVVIFYLNDEKTDRFVRAREEPYAEALRIVNSTPEHETQQDDGKGCF